MKSKDAITAKDQMLIRRPAADVFEAFVDPAVTTRFWFSKGSARLEPGATVSWDWEMYGFSTRARVLEFERNRRLLVEWSDDDSSSTLIEWTFEARGPDQTFVKVENWGFSGTPEEIVAKALDSSGGFAFVLAAAKAWLEHGVELNVVRDHAPDMLVAR